MSEKDTVGIGDPLPVMTTWREFVREVGALGTFIFCFGIFGMAMLVSRYRVELGFDEVFYQKFSNYVLSSVVYVCIFVCPLALAMAVSQIILERRKRREKVEKERTDELLRNSIIKIMIDDGEDMAHALADSLSDFGNTVYLSKHLSLRWQTYLKALVETHGVFKYAERRKIDYRYTYWVLALTPIGRKVFEDLRHTTSDGIFDEIRQGKKELIEQNKNIEHDFRNPKLRVIVSTPLDR